MIESGFAMTTSDQERVTCPNCSKGYRWKPALVGRSVPCQACSTTFDIPDQPGPGLLPKPIEDDGLYELAADPDDEPEQPPAFTLPKDPPAEAQSAPAVTPAIETAPVESAIDLGDEGSEPIVHRSEAAKAARREELRIAAAEAEAQGSWRDYKWLIIVLSVLALLGLIYWGMHLFADAVEDGLHNTQRHDNEEVIVVSHSYHWDFDDE